MKRQRELDNDDRFFKKSTNSDKSGSKKYPDLTQRLIDLALSYQGKLHHINSSGFYLSEGWFRQANDFILYFCDGIGTVPPAIREAVHDKFENRKGQGTAFNLCCWEFCCLVFYELGLISKEQIDDLCYIVYKSNEFSEEPVLTLADAFYKAPFSDYEKHSQNSLPSPGDLLLFIRAYGEHNSREISHTAICTDDKGGYIELGCDSSQVSDNRACPQFKAIF